MAIAIAWFGCSYFLVGLSSTQITLVLAAGVLGVGTALWHPPAIGMLSTRFPDRRAFVMSLHGIGASVGDILGPVVAGALLAFASYQAIFKGTLVPAVVIGVLLFVIFSRMGAGKARGHSSLGDYFKALKVSAAHRPLMTSILAGSLRSGAQIILMAFVPIYARSSLDLSPALVGIMSALLLGMSLISQPLLGYYSDSIGRKKTALPGLVVLCAVTPLLGLTTGAWTLLPLVTIIGTFLFSSGLLINALGLDIAPAELASSTTAAQFLAGLTFGTIGPLLAGAAGDAFGIEATFYVATLLFALTLILVLTLPAAEQKGKTARFAAS